MAKLEVIDGVAELDRDAWDRLVGADSPFLEWDWLASLEDSGALAPESGWYPRILVAREAGELLAASPLYIKQHSEGEFVFDWGWADAAERAGQKYYPKLWIGVPFTPVTGTRFLVDPLQDRARWIQDLGNAVRELCAKQGFSSVHACFCLDDEVAPLRAAGYELRHGIQYHWQNPGYANFDAYLSDFRSKRRNQIRRERRALVEQGVEIKVHAGADIDDSLLDPMYRFYCANVSAHVWGRQYLNRKFFELIWERFRSRLCLIVAYLDGEPIAGTLNVVKGDVFYGRYWGCTRQLRHLHFNVSYYSAVEYCIEQGLRRFEPGAGGEHKQVRGFDAQTTRSMHYIEDLRLREAVGQFLEAERREADRAVDHLQSSSPLKSTRTSSCS